MNKNKSTCQKVQLFSAESLRGHRWQIFQLTELGKLYQCIPFAELSKLLPKKTTNLGAKPWFGTEGFFGLMFLKSYLGLSDRKLIDRINTDWVLQMFCGMSLSDNQMIKDKNIVSRIRQYLGEHLDIDSFQDIFLDNWKDSLQDTHCMLLDATVFESYIKKPTDEKLLWDCCTWIFENMFEICKVLSIRRPRSRYKEQQLKQSNFSKTKKKTYKLKQRRKRALLYLLNKGLGQLEIILSEHRIILNDLLDKKFFIYHHVIKTVYSQQKYLFENQTTHLSDRIVSLFKPYLRSIVRGKESKRVEFGAKLHIRQVDGIDIIDKLSFKPYNESKYLKQSIIRQKEQFSKCTHVGVDNIYGTNANGCFMKKNNIYNCLKRKGRTGQYEQDLKTLRSELGKERSTVLEGSFGNEKNHYNLNKVKARTEPTEIIWILFGIMTANGIKIVRRRDKFKRGKKVS